MGITPDGLFNFVFAWLFWSAAFSAVPMLLVQTGAPQWFLMIGLASWGLSTRYGQELDEVRIIPVFQTEHELKVDTFGRGFGIARQFHQLERRAGELGLLPFSHFGFAHGLADGHMTWHPVGELAATVQGLLGESSDPELRTDIESWAGALSRGGDGRVALLVRSSFGGTSLEWEQLRCSV